MSRSLSSLILVLIFLSCNQKQIEKDGNIIIDNFEQITTKTLSDYKIHDLFDKAIKSDSLEYNNQFENNLPFLFIKSGQIISDSEKNLVVVDCPTDTTYFVRLYSLQNNNWIISDTISNLEAFPVQFDIIFDDYNFDSQTDIYIQVTASNGYSLSRGHLLIINPSTKKFELHEETRNLANMKPDIKTKTIKSELWNGYDINNNQQVTIFTNKWINGKLKTVSKIDTILN